MASLNHIGILDLDDPNIRRSYLKILRKAVDANVDDEWIYWKYESSPLLKKWGMDRPLVFGALDANNCVVGISHYMPYEFADGVNFLKALKGRNAYIAPHFRGRGIFSEMLKKAHDKAKHLGIHFFYRFPNFSSYPVFLKAEHQDFGVVDTSFYFNSVADTVTTKLFKKETTGKPLKWFHQIPTKSSGCTSYSMNKVSKVPDLTAYWLRTIGEGKFFNWADPLFVKWRYLEKPGATYHYISTENGYLIYTLFKRNNLREAFIVDIFIKRKEDLYNLLAKMGEDLAGIALHLVRAVVFTEKELMIWLNEIGFINRSSYIARRLMPQRRILVKPLSTSINIKSLENLSLRDCDQDQE